MLALLYAVQASESSTCEPESIAAADDKCNFTASNCVDDFSGKLRYSPATSRRPARPRLSACNWRGSGIACSYVELEFCSLGGSGAALGALSAALLLVLISGLGSTADVFFIPQLNYLSALLRLSPDVAGITLLALGNGAPDVFTAIAVAHSADFPLLLSDLLGGSVFIATVVLGAVTLTAHKYQQRRTAGNLVAAVDDGRPAWTIEPLAFWRDMGVYLFAIVAALAVAADGQIWLAESLLFLGIYLGYIALVLLLPRLRTMFPALFGGRRVAVASGNVNGSALLPAASIVAVAASASVRPFGFDSAGSLRKARSLYGGTTSPGSPPMPAAGSSAEPLTFPGATATRRPPKSAGNIVLSRGSSSTRAMYPR